MNKDPLFVGLTRPPMLLGVSLMFAVVNMLICGIIYIMMTSVKVVLLGVLLHLVGFIICFKEPRFIELWIMKASKCNKCPNKGYYGANSYYC
ncbi:MAG: VirB3 family type IV secretion system protein [Rickettsiaceae bacterium]|nr:VirB3 family type IV secretion system protein [Rickettsiaceae bacterium]